MRPTLVFDLDNTLVECGQYYIDATKAFSEFQAERTGCESAFAEELQNAIDVTMVKRPGGFKRDRFPTSFRATSLALDAIFGLTPDADAAKRSFDFADAVFTAPYDLYPGALQTLQYYGAGGWQLALLTKGDDPVQEYKIEKHQLRKWFGDRVLITLYKNKQVLAEFLDQHLADPARTWVIGDSVRDDIGPALQIGVGAIEVDTVTGKWGYENTSHDADHVVHAVRELRLILPQDPSSPLARHGKGVSMSV